MMNRKLNGKQSKCILVPYNLIVDATINKKRVLVYSYLYLKSGIDNTLLFNTENFKQYAGKKIGIGHAHDSYADTLLEIMKVLKDKWFVSYDGDIMKGKYKEIEFNKDKVFGYCAENKFAIIYLDELDSILSYQNINSCDRLDNSIILLVFLYLRANIPIRHKNRFSNPEAYDAYYKVIGNDLGVSERMASKAIDVLKILKLIYVTERCPTKYYDNHSKKYKYKTPTNIFCNTYKRIKNGNEVYLIAEGDDYYLAETEKKIKYLEKNKII